MRVLAVVVLGALTLSQSAPNLVRFGPNATLLTERDLAAILALSDVGGRTAWAIRVSRGWSGWGAQVFFPADQSGDELRRGPMLAASARVAPGSASSVPRTWRAAYPGRWAQVPLTGSNPDVLSGPRDLNRPFRVHADLTDDDLLAIIGLIRSSPTVPASPMRPSDPDRPPIQVRGDWPVSAILPNDGSPARQASDAGDVVRVALIDMSPRENSGQDVILERTVRGWIIARVGWWIAD
jgi:hypothetical protein